MEINGNETKYGRTGLVGLVKKIDGNLELVKRLGEGGYGIVLKVKSDRYYRLKVSKGEDVPGRYDTLEREYSILTDLSRTGAVPRPVKFYENAPCALYDKKGKYAYLTEFVDGEVLSKSEKQSEISLAVGLMDLVGRVHQAGYKFGKDSDLNADNILSGRDGKLYLIDLMYLTPLKEKIPFGMTKEERERVNEIIRRYSY